jgi:two-component system, OmpR family, KDP operon response regulator KdpE
VSGERILVCDDDPQVVRALRLFLREAGYTVLICGTGEEALDCAATKGPHVAVIDLMLPDLSGIEVCRQLREWSDIPILVLSALGEQEMKIEALQTGADDYVTKPFGPGELVARVAALLRRAGRSPTDPVIECDGLRIDFAAHRVTLDGDEIHLTPIEFSLLRALATHRGALMTHRALLVEVWGPEYEDALHGLRTHIANLRRKLASGSRTRNFIRTDSGIGYRFIG